MTPDVNIRKQIHFSQFNEVIEATSERRTVPAPADQLYDSMDSAYNEIQTATFNPDRVLSSVQSLVEQNSKQKSLIEMYRRGLAGEKTKAKASIYLMKNRFQEKAKHANKLWDEKVGLTSEVNSLKRKQVDSDTQIQDYQKKLKVVNESLDKFEEHSKATQETLGKWKEKESNWNEQRVKIMDDNKALKEKLNTTSTSLTKYKAHSDESKKVLATWKEKEKTWKDDRVKLHKQINQLKSSVTDLESREKALQEKETSFAERQKTIITQLNGTLNLMQSDTLRAQV